jgi:uncharacterized protein with gpF-like domain
MLSLAALMKRPVTRLGAPIHPNAGNAVIYRKRLDALIDEMHRSLIYWLCARWRSDPPVLAADESPAAGLRRTMKVLGRRWQSRFDEAAPSLAEYFAKKAADRATGKLGEILDQAGMTVQFKTTPAVRDTLTAVTAENVGLIKSIASEHLSDVEGAVMRSISQGRNLTTLTKELEHRYQLTRNRAALIARDQNNKGTAVIARVRQTEAGITRARWLHSSAGKTPRPEHVAFAAGRLGGPFYDPAKGAFLEGKWVWPGTEIGCRCVSRPVIPGFE